MVNKYNVGEPVCVYGWVRVIAGDGVGGLTYDVTIKSADGEVIDIIMGVPEDQLTTVF